MAPRKKKEVETPAPLPKFIITTEATYINNYVIQARTMEEAAEFFQMVREQEREGDVTCLQQLMGEEVLQVKEAM